MNDQELKRAAELENFAEKHGYHSAADMAADQWGTPSEAAEEREWEADDWEERYYE